MDHGFGSWPTIHALRSGARTAYVDGPGGAQTTWAQVEEHPNRLADALRAKGVRRGDRIAMLMFNSPQMMETYFAVAKLGAVAVPVNFRLHPHEMTYVLDDSSACALVYSTIFEEAAKAALADNQTVRVTVSVPGAAQRAGGGLGEYGDLLAAGSPARVVRDVAESDVCCLTWCGR